ncbi:helix-turn-helix domain-containing protein [Phreatobacter sp. HK31-P]
MNHSRQHWGELRSQVALLSILVSGGSDSPPPFNDTDCGSLIAAIDLIHADYSRDLSVPEMARRAAMSRFHFIRRFASAFGITPYQYLLRVRICHAARLIAATEHPPGTIARLVGFTSPGQMSRHFKLAFGLSPTSFRGTLYPEEVADMN